MPAILSPELQAAWLNRRTNRAELLSMLVPFPASDMNTYPVSISVNSPEIDTPVLLDRIDAEPGQTLSLF
jgi:putative SOS response-associated peptidase YedK